MEKRKKNYDTFLYLRMSKQDKDKCYEIAKHYGMPNVSTYFRELIKILGTKFKARIEMRQIGNRDETKQVGAIGICGRVTCCKAFLNDFDKVSIKMAKNQNISLNPTRINGMCGRLLCCFKYEDDFYAEMQKKMPKENAVVSTPDGKGTVSARDFLRETVSVTFTKDESSETKIYDLKDIQIPTKDNHEKNR